MDTATNIHTLQAALEATMDLQQRSMLQALLILVRDEEWARGVSPAFRMERRRPEEATHGDKQAA